MSGGGGPGLLKSRPGFSGNGLVFGEFLEKLLAGRAGGHAVWVGVLQAEGSWGRAAG